VDFRLAIEKVAALAGELVDVQLLTRGDGAVPLVELSGVLKVSEGAGSDGGRPIHLSVSGGTVWLWPDRFVAADALGSGGAVELITTDAIVLVGPKDGQWVE
jgi:hypothetical protein